MIGRRGECFDILQFRTIVYVPALASWTHQKVARFGGFLRYTRIESLPQLSDVLIGDMRIIEPDGLSRSFLG